MNDIILDLEKLRQKAQKRWKKLLRAEARGDERKAKKHERKLLRMQLMIRTLRLGS